MKKMLIVAVALSFVAPALAQHDHHKGPNGGTVEDVAGVHVEMVASGKTVTFNVFDEVNKPLPTEGFSGAALLISGSERETLPLTATGTALKAESKSDIAKGASVSLTLKTVDGKTGQAKFKP
ncbi:hypothetical protein [Rhodopseudomonas palustris]|uniref:hypothetical protein n=1 Tax=Rhodopseudomonas palustris TaxID=1076 RepID=UPI000E5ADF49|nr:hypothetical protein [Rhodopseudomonas palustris]QLH71144.1 hypothetical protein HZF03_10250 [Rhodopseudomonas palustris]RIA02836.1 hypothetical protein D1920_06225 [Rhodopseudomonas palustris]